MEAITTTTTAVCLPSPVQLVIGGVCLGIGIKAGFKAFEACESASDAVIAKYKAMQEEKAKEKKVEPKPAAVTVAEKK